MDCETSAHICCWGVMAFSALWILSDLLRLPMLFAIGVIVMIVNVLQYWIFYRCPHCDLNLGRLYWTPRRCPHCGKYLDES